MVPEHEVVIVNINNEDDFEKKRVLANSIFPKNDQSGSNWKAVNKIFPAHQTHLAAEREEERRKIHHTFAKWNYYDREEWLVEGSTAATIFF